MSFFSFFLQQNSFIIDSMNENKKLKVTKRLVEIKRDYEGKPVH